MPRDRSRSLKRKIAERLRGPSHPKPSATPPLAEIEAPSADDPVSHEPDSEEESQAIEDTPVPEIVDSGDPEPDSGAESQAIENAPVPEILDSGEPEADPDVGPVHRATLRLLPGRLQPEDTEVVQQEVRFLRSARPEQGVTLGWEEGDPPEHVTLDHPSLLPKHARMFYRGREWWIEGLSDRRPVIVNERSLRTADGLHRLQDGDRIRMGDARFVFKMT